jgi:pseudaminic acid cytidylyltransferase
VHKIIAYIPARGGSKRIPKKNIKLLGGKPSLTHVIEVLRRLDFLEGVCVSTDSPEISSVAIKAGATVLGLRDTALADDHVTLQELFNKDAERYLRYFNISLDEASVLMTIPTAALVTPDVYRHAYECYLKEKPSMLLSTVGYPISPYWALSKTKDGKWSPLFPEKLLIRSQDLPETQVDACLFYFLNYKKMVNHKTAWMEKNNGLVCFPVADIMAVDVDTPKDWSELETKYKEKNK